MLCSYLDENLAEDCHGLGWNKVNFLSRGSCDALFWIFFDENSGDNKPMVLVVAEQCSHCSSSTQYVILHKTALTDEKVP